MVETQADDPLKELKCIVEAAILAAEQPLTIADLINLFPSEAQPTRDELRQALAALADDCEDRGIELKNVGKAYRFQSRERYAPWLRKLYEGRPPRYSRAQLETLAIIAYRQPVTRGEIEEIRGVSLSTDTMRALLERGWVKEVGHRDVPGHPALLATTQSFLEYFSLESLKDLPPLREIRDVQEIARELNLRLPLEETAEPVAGPLHTAEIIPLETAMGSDPDADADGDRETT